MTVAAARTSGDVDITNDVLTLDFGQSNWSEWQTVTVAAAVDSDAIDGQAEFTFSSTDWTSAVLTANEIDRHRVFVLSVSNVVVPEGSSDGFTVQLAGEPENDVQIDVSVQGTGFVLTSATTLTFTPANWDQPQTITIAANEDVNAQFESGQINLTSSGWQDVIVPLVAGDNDRLINVTGPSSLTEGETGTYEVTLAGPPDGETIVDVILQDAFGLRLVGPIALTFNDTNWSAPQTIQVTAENDLDAIDGTATIEARSAFGPNPTELTNLNGRLYFGATDDAHGNELWMVDGNGANLDRLGDSRLGSGDGNPSKITDVNGRVFFTALDDDGIEQLFLANELGVGPTQITAFESYPVPDISDLTNVDGQLYFVAKDLNNRELWTVDQNGNGLTMIDMSPSGPSYAEYLLAVGDQLVFSASGDNGLGKEIWTITSPGTPPTLLVDVWSGSSSSNPKYLTYLNGQIYFNAGTSLGIQTEVWKVNLDGSQLTQVSTLSPAVSDPRDFIVVGDRLFFVAVESLFKNELWLVDEDGNGVTQVTPSWGLSSNPTNLTAVGDNLFFRSFDPDGQGRELWMVNSDGSGLTRVTEGQEIYPGAGSSDPIELNEVGSKLFFVATDANDEQELWMVNQDGTDLARVTENQEINRFHGSRPSNLVEVNGRLFFSATEPFNGRELWVVNGDGTGLFRVTENQEILGYDWQFGSLTVSTNDDDRSIIATPIDSNRIVEGDFLDYEIRLAGRPAGNVTVTTTYAGDPSIYTYGNTTPRVFTPENWQQPQIITLRSLLDSDAAAGSTTFTSSATGWTSARFIATELDTERQFVLTPGNVTVTEGQAARLLMFSCWPILAANVVVNIARLSGDIDLVVDGLSTLNFDSSNWDQPQTITLRRIRCRCHFRFGHV